MYEAACRVYPDAEHRVTGIFPKPNHKLELDIYVPSRQCAVEYDGDFWHSNYASVIINDAKKDRLCVEAGIRLLRIPEHVYVQQAEATTAAMLRFLEGK